MLIEIILTILQITKTAFEIAVQPTLQIMLCHLYYFL